MKRRVRLSVDQVEARTLPSPVTSAGVFLPPGITRFLAESSEAPPPVQVSPEGTVGFQPPGVIKGFNPQPDPPGLPAPFISANG